MEFVLADAESLPKYLYEALGRYRYRVFVERLGWRLDTPPGIERDQFDRPDTVHVIARDEEHQIVGCARLLPTTGPYLLGKVFPQLMNGLPPPSTPDVWELSRFAVVDLHTWRTGISGQKPSALEVDILRRSADYVTSKGAKRLLTVSPLAMERLLRKTGFHVHRAGPPVLVDGSPTFACWIELDDPFSTGRNAGKTGVPVNSDSCAQPIEG